jgi:vacuolar-type H+-ATPase subunit E/Vma4
MAEHGGNLAELRQQAVTDAATSLSQARAEAQRLLAEARAEAEAMRVAAQEAARAVVARAEREAATIDERSRQEFSWRRRQLRQQQEVLARWKQAMASQLASVSTLAVETARDLYQVSEQPFGEDMNADIGAAADTGDGSDDVSSDPEVQNSRSSALSSPRRAS